MRDHKKDFPNLQKILLGTVMLALSAYFLTHPIHSNYLAYHFPVKFDTSLKTGGLPAPDELGGHASKVLALLHIEAPAFVYLGDSAVVTVSATSPEGDPNEVNLPGLSLSGAGLDVQPPGWISLQKDAAAGQRAARWTIRAKEAGNYEMVLNSENQYVFSRHPPTGGISRPDLGDDGFLGKENSLGTPVPIFFSSNPVIHLEVRLKYRDYVALAWPILVGIMGSFLTVPGIIAYLKDRKKEREKERTKPFDPPLDSAI